jgi:predicted metal-dependent hydrolase
MQPPLPPFTVRVSKRARRVRLTVTPRDGLVVVVPAAWRGDPADLVSAQREWALRALDKVAEHRALHVGGPDALLPDIIELRLCGQRLPVEYRATGAEPGRVSARTHADAVVVSGDIDDGVACVGALSRWLDRTSRELLLPLLDEVASAAGISYASARVRRQRTRWGSCSARRTISLNRALVFLPAELVTALMLHELAHLDVMDHSPHFWRRLAQLDPAFAEHRAALRSAASLVPAWSDV